MMAREPLRSRDLMRLHSLDTRFKNFLSRRGKPTLIFKDTALLTRDPHIAAMQQYIVQCSKEFLCQVLRTGERRGKDRNVFVNCPPRTGLEGLWDGRPRAFRPQ
jgi:hypothetical protein